MSFKMTHPVNFGCEFVKHGNLNTYNTINIFKRESMKKKERNLYEEDSAWGERKNKVERERLTMRNEREGGGKVGKGKKLKREGRGKKKKILPPIYFCIVM
uniref:Uncharacterized protein n=1 Tax=Cacopsylla melanoneura TaxID=428564 RepID=A0A8D8W682_9HEMI